MNIALDSYFSGAGLMDLGLAQAGIEPQRSFEIDADCCETLRANFKHEVVQVDLTKKLVRSDKRAEVMVFTYPCTRYSAIADIHGTRSGDDLYLHALRHMAIEPPEVYVAENVPGMRKFPLVMEVMTMLPGYFVTVFCPVRSQTWLPQKRDRLIIIGSRRAFQWRAPVCWHPVRLRDIVEVNPVVDYPDYIAKRLNGSYRDAPIISDPARDDVAPTCVAHYAKDLSTRLVVDRQHPKGVRPYSVREYARLQGVPDEFRFMGGDRKAYKMIGNGVSVPKGRWVGEELKRYFAVGHGGKLN